MDISHMARFHAQSKIHRKTTWRIISRLWHFCQFVAHGMDSHCCWPWWNRKQPWVCRKLVTQASVHTYHGRLFHPFMVYMMYKPIAWFCQVYKGLSRIYVPSSFMHFFRDIFLPILANQSIYIPSVQFRVNSEEPPCDTWVTFLK